jgi:hypothetical protein
MANKKILPWGVFALSAFAATLFGCKDQKTSGASAPPAPPVTAAAAAVPEAVSDAAAAVSAGVESGWEKALDEYENAVDKYTALMKAIGENPTDTSLMQQVAAMQEEAEKIPAMLEGILGAVPAADMDKFQKRLADITAKQVQATQ